MFRLFNTLVILTAVCFLSVSAPSPVNADRIKDVVDVVGARSNQLVGYGIVVGLGGTGDGNKAEFTLQSVAAMLRRLGVRVDPSTIKLKNAAAVIVTANIPAFMNVGQEMDVVVSSLGDAKSLQGGTLIQTPLRGADRQVYAVAQGPLSIGGFGASGGGGAKSQKNHLTVGRIPRGAIVERKIETKISNDNSLKLALRVADSVTASRTVEVINKALEGPFAKAIDPGMIDVKFPEKFKGGVVELLSVIGTLNVDRDVKAKVIINERTGTVVVGSEVTLMPVAIAHGGITVEVSKDTMVTQPAPLSVGRTTVTKDTTMETKIESGDLHYVPQAATVGDLVGAMNSLGVKPTDLVIIFQALAAAGALNATIEVQ
ncbi:MAG: flagellar basal body P-ring protein FlgI [Deltaproteobacteria bacterium]|nr:flagellar basal body P-ring protein FlgI [Deltaproteobacteria bacterium]